MANASASAPVASAGGSLLLQATCLSGRTRTKAMCRSAGLSRSDLERRFRATLGQSPSRYLLRLRMRHAADALAEEWCSMGEIASSGGYESEVAFQRPFDGLSDSPRARMPGTSSVKSIIASRPAERVEGVELPARRPWPLEKPGSGGDQPGVRISIICDAVGGRRLGRTRGTRQATLYAESIRARNRLTTSSVVKGASIVVRCAESLISANSLRGIMLA
jgi:Helix-turn-helix domain